MKQKFARVILAVLGIPFLLIGFQNCSGVQFQTTLPSVNSKVGVDNSDLVKEIVDESEPESEEDFLGQLILKNPACVSGAKPRLLTPVDLDGGSLKVEGDPSNSGFLFHNGYEVEFMGGLEEAGVKDVKSASFEGIFGYVFIENVEELRLNGEYRSVIVKSPGGEARVINGRSQELFVDAEEVRLNGDHKHVCVHTNELRMNGIYGDSMAPTVLIGRSEQAHLDALNGIRQDVVIDQFQVDTINGQQRDLFFSRSTVDHINGRARALYLFNSTRVKSINSMYETIYLFDKSSIDEIRQPHTIEESVMFGLPVKIIKMSLF